MDLTQEQQQELDRLLAETPAPDEVELREMAATVALVPYLEVLAYIRRVVYCRSLGGK
jgi:hypothetical protein